jgi:eukaryotic translation initiation factor 2C
MVRHADLATGQSQAFITALSPEGIVVPSKSGHSSSDDESRRFKVVVKLVAEIDLEAVMKFCRPSESVPQGEEACLTGTCAAPNG